ncbi:MAG: tRNA lysidine(34) synthetase TilS [Chloroflexi bacterium]|nr:tRNA lysidine(34) synthetase TilS [Chloroflexota bacterium]
MVQDAASSDSAAAARRAHRRVESAVNAALRGPCRVWAEHGADAREPLPIVVGVSGGADSLTLLHALVRVSRRATWTRRGVRIAPIVAYFDHRIRPPKDIDAERAFVAEQAQRLGLAFMTGDGDVRAAARQSQLSLEDAARQLRYEFLGGAAARMFAGLVAVGHTQSDQAETVLLRMVRGTGVAGLGAMEWRARWPLGGAGPAIIRPLLGLTRDDTEAYCAALGLTPRSDPENASPSYRRNRVRHELMPVLASMNPKATQALARLAESARQAQDVVSAHADAVWPAVVRVHERSPTPASTAARKTSGIELALLRHEVAALPPAVRTEILRRAIALAIGAELPPEHSHLRAAESLLSGGPAGAVNLPGGVVALLRGEDLLLGVPGGEHDEGKLFGEDVALEISGVTYADGWRIECRRVQSFETDASERCVGFLKPEVQAAGLTVGGYRRGERIEPVGMRGSKKVQDLLVDARVPRHQRGWLPMVRSGDRLAWVVGVRMAEWAAARPGEAAVRIAFLRVSNA